MLRIAIGRLFPTSQLFNIEIYSPILNWFRFEMWIVFNRSGMAWPVTLICEWQLHSTDPPLGSIKWPFHNHWEALVPIYIRYSRSAPTDWLCVP